MRLSKNKIRLVRDYCKRRLPAWRDKYSPNIVGVHLGFKRQNNVKTKTYAIIFHVEQKLGIPISKIPRVIHIRSKGQKISLPTDVIQTGLTRLLNVMMGDRAQSLLNLDEFGTAGLFLTVNNKLYVCSNMHVLGPQHIEDRFFSRPPSQQFKADVLCSNDLDGVKAFLEKAEFDQTDLAVARFQFPGKVTNRVRRLGQPSGFLKDSDIFEGMPVQMFGARSKKVVFGQIEEIGVAKIVRYDTLKVTITDLIATSLFVQSGDSGSVILNEFLEVVGILVSSDDQFSYVIPWSSIEKFISNL